MKINLDKRFRLKNFDYGGNHSFFVTVRTKDRKHYLGSIENEKFLPTKIGSIVVENWKSIPDHFGFVVLDEFQCMPDHFHGIIHFKKANYNNIKKGNQFGPQKDNLGSVMRTFKASITSFAKINELEFKWHPRYHDHVIHSEEELERIRNYIRANVANWKK